MVTRRKLSRELKLDVAQQTETVVWCFIGTSLNLIGN
jgi:hypothetical protein